MFELESSPLHCSESPPDALQEYPRISPDGAISPKSRTVEERRAAEPEKLRKGTDTWLQRAAQGSGYWVGQRGKHTH